MAAKITEATITCIEGGYLIEVGLDNGSQINAVGYNEVQQATEAYFASLQKHLPLINYKTVYDR